MKLEKSLKLMMTLDSRSNYLEDVLVPINLVMSVERLTTSLKIAQKIFVIGVTKKDILPPFVLTKYRKETTARPAIKVITLIDNALKTTAEDVLN